MKKIIVLLLLFVAFQSQAQDEITEIEQYAEVIATGRFLSNKVTIEIDYGLEKSIWDDTRLKGDDGKLEKFNTITDALNFMGKNGWKFVNAFPVSNANSGLVYHYLFKKIIHIEK